MMVFKSFSNNTGIAFFKLSCACVCVCVSVCLRVYVCASLYLLHIKYQIIHLSSKVGPFPLVLTTSRGCLRIKTGLRLELELG